ncbi:helix-turn-helix transcriptional regulator [Haloplanus salilacus]|uniref:helix-turn-helix transcriptional regulator n=1 Tax=Haloplanus salilacus TaxID=2949994 RepID=UPI0030CB6EF1
MRIAVPLLALLILLAGTLPAVAATGVDTPATDSGGAATPADRPALVGPSPARIDSPLLTEIHIAPDPGGDARWTVSVRYDLSNETDRAAFDRYGRDFEAGDADVGLDADFFRTLANEASLTAGREMEIVRTTRNATVRNGTGVLSLSFTWTNFVSDAGDGFVIRDAVLMPGDRTWLTSIGPGQRLVVETPDGYQVTDTRFGLENGSVVVDGPHTFQEPLTISYQQAVVEEPSEPPWSLLVGAVVVVGLSLVAAIVYTRRYRGDGAGQTARSPDAGDAASSPDSAGANGDAAETDASGAADGDADADADDTDDVDPSLLSDEERVEHLLDRNGGRMRQARIVRETGWSDAKVSQLLSTMADDGRVEKLRLGRENLISLPDEER